MTLQRNTGFTLVELMIAIAIIAIIAAIAIPAYRGYIAEAEFGTAAKDLRQVQLILDDLASDNNLGALEPAGYANTVLGVYMSATGQVALDDLGAAPAGFQAWLDPWDNSYRYQRPAGVAQRDYLLFSQGPDATSGTDDDVEKD